MRSTTMRSPATHDATRPRRRRGALLTTGLMSLAVVLSPSAASASAVTSAAPAPAATSAAPAGAEFSVPSAAVVSATRPLLKYGSRGTAVTTLQRRLTALRYDVGGVDGMFGYNTLHAVLAFQKVQRIAVDGIVGPATWSRLDRPVIPKPRYTRSAAAIEVDLTRRVVLVTKGGTVTRILDASPGKPSTPTVTGSFSIFRRIDAWHRSPLGMLYRPVFFYRGYALHGSTSVPTYAASHGCVRVTVPAMDRLWSQLSIGERVYVYR